MHALTSIVLLGATGLRAVLAAPTVNYKRDLESFIETQEHVALEGVLCNIGASGCQAGGVPQGVVVASPSRSDPDYWYTWTRDAGLVMKGVVEHFSLSYNDTLQDIIQGYVASQAKLQGVSNPSGGFADGAGLAEPKYNVDLTEFTGAWGRPQRDGPPLRAIALIGYAKWLVQNGYEKTALDVVWPVIRNDLAYTTQYWPLNGFDLWEEVNGYSFFTVASSYRALVEGAALATSLRTSCTACETIAPHVLCAMQRFWDSNRGAMIANINTNNGRGGLDANTLLASIHGFDPALGCDSNSFQPCSDRALSNHKAVTDSMRVWPINSGIPQGQAVAVGRYVEDVYYNGNPWYLATHAAAEQLYDAIQVWQATGSISVTGVSLSFWRDLDSSISTGTYNSGSSTFQNLISKVMDYADGYLAVVQQYTPSNGDMAEQFEKSNGSPLSARDLTWSYDSFLSAVTARKQLRSSTHGWSSGSASLPSSCQSPTANGAYILATSTNFPSSVVPDGGSETITTDTPEPTSTICTLAVTFNVRVTTAFGETIKVVGSSNQLGNWNPNSAVALHADYYSEQDPLWQITVNMSPGQNFDYKFIRVSESGAVSWEADPNRNYGLPDQCGNSINIDTRWQ